MSKVIKMISNDPIKVKVKYFDKEIDKLEKIDKGDCIDLRIAETVDLKQGESKLVGLGVGMILPKGYEAHIYPRSSTFKKYGIWLTNNVGIIDNSYCGEDDEWKAMIYAVRDTHIEKNERILQFRIVENQPSLVFEEVEHLESVSRGGYGTTGVK